MSQLFHVQDIQSGPAENGALNQYWIDNPSATDLDPEDVGVAFAQQHLDVVRLVQNQDWEHIAVLITEVLSGITALVNLVGFVGARGESTTPASNTWSFPLKPIGPTIKRGAKRLVGVGEADSEDDLATTTAAAILSAITPTFYLPFEVGSTNVKFAIVRPNGTPPTSYLVSTVQGAIYRRIGTQVTRRLGRGGNSTSFSFVPGVVTSVTATSYASLTADPGDWVDAAAAILDPRALLSNPDYEATRTV